MEGVSAPCRDCSAVLVTADPPQALAMLQPGSDICLVDEGPATRPYLSGRRDVVEHDAPSSEHGVGLLPVLEVGGSTHLHWHDLALRVEPYAARSNPLLASLWWYGLANCHVHVRALSDWNRECNEVNCSEFSSWSAGGSAPILLTYFA